VNNIQLTGRLVANPAGKQLPDSSYVCEIRIAVDGMGRGARDETGYIDVHSYGESGKAAARVLTKGWLVAVSGHLQHEVYEKDGQKRSAYRVIGHVEFLTAPRNGAGDSAQEGEDWRSDLPDEVAFS
jgi:single-strand DNA-binding protein